MRRSIPTIPAQIKVGRRLAIKILNAARFALLQSEPRGAHHRAARSAACSPICRCWSQEATDLLRGVRLRARARTDRAFLLVVLRRLPGARQGAALRRFHAGGGGVGEQRNARRLVHAAPAVCAIPAVCDRGGLVVVASRFGAQGAVADERRSGRADWWSQSRGA